MTTTRRALAVLVMLAACSAPSEPTAQPEQGAQMRGTSLFAAEPDRQLRLPNRLDEISGLTYTADNRLLGHDDEHAVIYEIDVDTGEVIKRFALGDPVETGDFEGLAAGAGGALYLTTSTGHIYRFREGADGAQVRFETFDPGLEETCEVEGLAYHRADESLILACKTMHDRSMRDRVVLYSWPVRENAPARVWLNASRDAIAEAAGVRNFHPSAVEIDPASGRVILLAARQQAMAELSASGDVLAARSIAARHPQPEGVAITPQGALVIADEAGDNARAQLSRYPRAAR